MKLRFPLLFIFFIHSSSFVYSQTYTASDTSLLNYLKENAVYDNDFVRNTFYTWTTPEQISELRKNKKLLTKSKSETKGFSLYDLSLIDSSLKDNDIAQNNTIAQILLQEKFSKKRFAWPSSWATIMGWEGEKYGNQLIKIVLNDSAIIGRFVSKRYNPLLFESFVFYDLKGNKLDNEYVIKHNDKIAAIYHLNFNYKKRMLEISGKMRGTFSKQVYYREKGRYRSVNDRIQFYEFVIVNENMVEKWSYGTEEIKTKIKSEISLMQQLADRKNAKQMGYRDFRANKSRECEEVYSALDCGISELFIKNQCFNNDYYLFNKKKLKAIIKELQKALDNQSEPIKK